MRQLRGRWSRVRIVLRADSGFAREELMAWCESNAVDYLFGLARNVRLVRHIGLSQEAGAPIAASLAAPLPGLPVDHPQELVAAGAGSWRRSRPMKRVWETGINSNRRDAKAIVALGEGSRGDLGQTADVKSNVVAHVGAQPEHQHKAFDLEWDYDPGDGRTETRLTTTRNKGPFNTFQVFPRVPSPLRQTGSGLRREADQTAAGRLQRNHGSTARLVSAFAGSDDPGP